MKKNPAWTSMQSASGKHGGGSKGKNTHDPLHFLPALPQKRHKPEWVADQPSFYLSGKPPNADRQESFDIISALSEKPRKKPQRDAGGAATNNNNFVMYEAPK